ncbi:MAG: hypothetical protein QM778_29340 [Myxococcales bacterium]
MRIARTFLVVPALGSLTWLAGPQVARAEETACGNIFLTGDAKCEWREKEECKTECTTEKVVTACVAKIYTSCENQCTASASTECEAGCTQSCTTDCDAQAAMDTPSCEELCDADCKKSCTDDETGRVQGCCMHNCEARCERKCEDAPDVMEPAQCGESCTTACGGSCTAQANVQCQQDCQTQTYQECETELVTTCNTKCEDDGGAIFCDGQFVNAANAKDCAADLKAKFNFDINVHAAVDTVTDTAHDVADETGDAAEDGAQKTKKKSKDMCSVSAAGLDGGAGLPALLVLGSVAAMRIGRRRAKTRR